MIDWLIGLHWGSWAGTILLSIIGGFLYGYIKPRFDSFLSFLSKWRAGLTTKRKEERESRIQSLTSTQNGLVISAIRVYSLLTRFRVTIGLGILLLTNSLLIKRFFCSDTSKLYSLILLGSGLFFAIISFYDLVDIINIRSELEEANKRRKDKEAVDGLL